MSVEIRCDSHYHSALDGPYLALPGQPGSDPDPPIASVYMKITIRALLIAGAMLTQMAHAEGDVAKRLIGAAI